MLHQPPWLHCSSLRHTNILSQICSNSFKGFCYHKLSFPKSIYNLSIYSSHRQKFCSSATNNSLLCFGTHCPFFFFLLWIGKSVPIEPLCATLMAHINSTTAFLDGQHHLIQLFLACCVSGNALVESLHIILFSRNIFGSCGIGASWWGEVQLHIQCYHHRIVPTRIPESNTRPHTEPLQTPNPMSECCPNVPDLQHLRAFPLLWGAAPCPLV